MAQLPSGAPFVGLSFVFLLVGCASGATSTPSSTPGATPTAIPTPFAYGPVTVVTGTATCPTADLGTPTIDADGVQHFRDVNFVCTILTDDPRVSGTHTSGAWNLDVWGETDLSSGAAVQWGTPRLENAGGAWEGRATGVASVPDRGDIISIWYQGTGGYAGLSYFELWTGQDPWLIQGQIFPGEPPIP